jgi:hypothetical protein
MAGTWRSPCPAAAAAAAIAATSRLSSSGSQNISAQSMGGRALEVISMQGLRASKQYSNDMSYEDGEAHTQDCATMWYTSGPCCSCKSQLEGRRWAKPRLPVHQTHSQCMLDIWASELLLLRNLLLLGAVVQNIQTADSPAAKYNKKPTCPSRWRLVPLAVSRSCAMQLT